MGAQITLDISDYEKLKTDVADARADTARIQAELDAERKRPVDDRLAQAYVVIDAAKPIIDYAVGNCSPEFSRRWPYDELRTIAKNIGSVGHVLPRDKERALLWTEFVEQIIEQDRQWSLGQNVNARLAEVVKDAMPKGPSKEEYLAALEASQKMPLWAWGVVALAILVALSAVVFVLV